MAALGGSPEGISPLSAPRTVHEPLSIHTAPDVRPLPWHKTLWRGLPAEPVKQTVTCPFGPMAHPGPPNDIGIDPYQGRTELIVQQNIALSGKLVDVVSQSGRQFQWWICFSTRSFFARKIKV